MAGESGGISHADLLLQVARARRAQAPPGGPTGFALVKASTSDYDFGYGPVGFDIADLPPYQSSSTGSTSMFPKLSTADQFAVLVGAPSSSSPMRGGMYRAFLSQIPGSTGGSTGGGGGSGFPVGPTTYLSKVFEIQINSTTLPGMLWRVSSTALGGLVLQQMDVEGAFAEWTRYMQFGDIVVEEIAAAAPAAGAEWGISANGGGATIAQMGMTAYSSASTLVSLIGLSAGRYQFDTLSTTPQTSSPGNLYRVGNVVHITT